MESLRDRVRDGDGRISRILWDFWISLRADEALAFGPDFADD